MNYGGDAADQIVRYSLDGVDHGLRLSGTLAKHLAVFVAEECYRTYICFSITYPCFFVKIRK